jgi:hypothetical protein
MGDLADRFHAIFAKRAVRDVTGVTGVTTAPLGVTEQDLVTPRRVTEVRPVTPKMPTVTPGTPVTCPDRHFPKLIDSADQAALAAVDRAVPQAWAQAFSELEAGCPDGVDEPRWRQAIDDGRRFLETWGVQAGHLRWKPGDLFGLHQIAPLARYDQMGCVWLLQGRPVVELTEMEAIIQTAGGTLTFRRMASKESA